MKTCLKYSIGLRRPTPAGLSSSSTTSGKPVSSTDRPASYRPSKTASQVAVTKTSLTRSSCISATSVSHSLLPFKTRAIVLSSREEVPLVAPRLITIYRWATSSRANSMKMPQPSSSMSRSSRKGLRHPRPSQGKNRSQRPKSLAQMRRVIKGDEASIKYPCP